MLYDPICLFLLFVSLFIPHFAHLILYYFTLILYWIHIKSYWFLFLFGYDFSAQIFFFKTLFMDILPLFLIAPLFIIFDPRFWHQQLAPNLLYSFIHLRDFLGFFLCIESWTLRLYLSSFSSYPFIFPLQNLLCFLLQWLLNSIVLGNRALARWRCLLTFGFNVISWRRLNLSFPLLMRIRKGSPRLLLHLSWVNSLFVDFYFLCPDF